MISFWLNDRLIETDVPPGTTVLDFVRYHQHLTGTKIGCREGDCGACTIMVGTKSGETIQYAVMTSCLMPIANARGKHIVTIEGINAKEDHLTPVQSAMVSCNASQCGFCTVGFVMSLTCHALNAGRATNEEMKAAIDGNICRCTGYASILRAGQEVNRLIEKNPVEERLSFALASGIVPPYFEFMSERMKEPIQSMMITPSHNETIVGGGTDLYVQRPEQMVKEWREGIPKSNFHNRIEQTGEYIEIGGAATVTDLLESEVLQHQFPDLREIIKLVSSTPIRNMATLAGNLVNASPIGDLTIWFLALDASVVLRSTTEREIMLRDFYHGYKQTALQPGEMVDRVRYKALKANEYFHFEKVSKRRHLDIASVNTAMRVSFDANGIEHAHLSIGGVSPIPLYVKNTSACLMHKSFPVSDHDLQELDYVLQTEIHPISDARGSERYKRLLTRQLFHIHLEKIAAFEQH